jgi:magnesium transporter
MSEPTDQTNPDAGQGGQDLYGLTPDLLSAILEALSENDDVRLEALVVPLHAADLADLLEQITSQQRRQVLDVLKPDVDAEVLAYLGEAVLDDVHEILGTGNFAHLVQQLETDDAVDVLEDLDHEVQTEVLAAVPFASRREVEEGLTFPEDSAGRLMRRDVVAVPMFWNIGQTIDYLRASDDLPEDFYEIFIVDPHHRPLGSVPISRILRNKRDVLLESLVEDDEPTTVSATMDQEEVAYIFQQYGLSEMAVTDADGRLLGAITFDDVVDVIGEETEEDVLRLGGVVETDLNDEIITTARKRFLWLFVNLGTAILASSVIGVFEGTLEKIVALAILMPIVASMGGNAGTQTMTVAVRAIATRDLTRANALRVVGKEVVVGLLNGLLFAVVIGFVAWQWFELPLLGVVIGIAMVVNLLIAGLAGALIPLTLQHFKIDPAVAAGVFLTTVTDVVGFFVFLALGAAILL